MTGERGGCVGGWPVPETPKNPEPANRLGARRREDKLNENLPLRGYLASGGSHVQ